MKDIRRLRGIGAVLASRINETRHDRPFSDLQDLVDRVKGISNQTAQSWSQQSNIFVTFRASECDDSSDSFLCSTLAVTAVGAVLSFIIILSAVTFTNFDFTIKLLPESAEKNGPARNHTIYFECLDDRDCALGQKCYPGKLHPREGPLNLYKMTEEELNQGGIWTQSKWGFEQVVQRSPLKRGIREWALESGRRCWNISNQTGADCGDKHLQICDEDANLTCVYGKCRITNDVKLLNHDYALRNTKGGRFASLEDAGCESEKSLGQCLVREMVMPSTKGKHLYVDSKFRVICG